MADPVKQIGIPKVEASETHRQVWKDMAKKGLDKWGVKSTAYNQNANALTMCSIIRDIITNNPDKDVMEWVKMIRPYAKICGNASANRQALNRKKDEVVSEVDDDLDEMMA